MSNPFAQPLRPVQVTIEAAPETLDILELRAEEFALAITRHIEAVKPHLVLLIADTQEEQARAMVASVDPSARTRVMKLADINWVEKVQKDFPPFALGPFYVYGSHAKESVPRNHLPLLIDAVAAFGTGEHATTAGCLLALAAHKKTHAHVGQVLDVGCGTAILGIAAARLWKSARIVACDNDAMAVTVSRVNLKANHIAQRATAHVSDGYRHRPMRRAGKAPLIVANILAVPLMRMAKDAARQLAPGGTLIVSGLMNHQEAMVLAAHRAQGLYLKHRLRRGRWSVLVLG